MFSFDYVLERRRAGHGPLEFWGLGGSLLQKVRTLLQWDPEAGRGGVHNPDPLRAQVCLKLIFHSSYWWCRTRYLSIASIWRASKKVFYVWVGFPRCFKLERPPVLWCLSHAAILEKEEKPGKNSFLGWMQCAKHNGNNSVAKAKDNHMCDRTQQGGIKPACKKCFIVPIPVLFNVGTTKKETFRKEGWIPKIDANATNHNKKLVFKRFCKILASGLTTCYESACGQVSHMALNRGEDRGPAYYFFCEKGEDSLFPVGGSRHGRLEIHQVLRPSGRRRRLSAGGPALLKRRSDESRGGRRAEERQRWIMISNPRLFFCHLLITKSFLSFCGLTSHSCSLCSVVLSPSSGFEVFL